MRIQLLSVAVGVVLPFCLAAGAHAQHRLAQQPPARFVCLAPAGHVCQFTVRTSGSEINFALPSGERTEVSGVTPYADKYCVCDPGPVTPDCKAPFLGYWCLGFWIDVTTGLNSENEIANNRFAADRGKEPIETQGALRGD